MFIRNFINIKDIILHYFINAMIRKEFHIRKFKNKSIYICFSEAVNEARITNDYEEIRTFLQIIYGSFEEMLKLFKVYIQFTE